MKEGGVGGQVCDSFLCLVVYDWATPVKGNRPCVYIYTVYEKKKLLPDTNASYYKQPKGSN